MTLDVFYERIFFQDGIRYVLNILNKDQSFFSDVVRLRKRVNHITEAAYFFFNFFIILLHNFNYVIIKKCKASEGESVRIKGVSVRIEEWKSER